MAEDGNRYLFPFLKEKQKIEMNTAVRDASKAELIT